MIELLIALGGVGYYGTKISRGRASAKACERHHIDRLTREETWLNQYTCLSLERQLESYIKSAQNHDAVIAETAVAYDAIQNTVFRIQQSGRYVEETFGCKCARNHLRIMLARRGYFSYYDALDGRGFSTSGPYGELSPHSIMDTAVLAWCTDEVRRRTGLTEPFVHFNSGYTGSGNGSEPYICIGPVIDAEKCTCHIHDIGWDLDCGAEPQLYFQNK